MSIPLLIEMAVLTPLIEEPCDKNGLFLVSKAECRMSNGIFIRHRTDFYGLCKRASIIFVIFLLVMHHRADAMNEFVANGIQN